MATAETGTDTIYGPCLEYISRLNFKFIERKDLLKIRTPAEIGDNVVSRSCATDNRSLLQHCKVTSALDEVEELA